MPSLAIPNQFCPTISIKVSTAKVPRFLKCGEIRGAPLNHGLGHPRVPTSATEIFSSRDSFAMNGRVCIPKRRIDGCLVEEYLTSSHSYLPSMCYCKLLENRVDIMTLLHVHDPPVLPELNYISINSKLLITSAESRERSFLDKIIYFILASWP